MPRQEVTVEIHKDIIEKHMGKDKTDKPIQNASEKSSSGRKSEHSRSSDKVQDRSKKQKLDEKTSHNSQEK